MASGHWDRKSSRYVTRTEMAEIAAVWRSFMETPLECTVAPEAMPRPSICDFEPLWAVCPQREWCGLVGDCERAFWRGVVIWAARRAVKQARE
jgi:hypothetical protein